MAVGIDVEIGVAGKHGRQLRLCAVVEQMAWNAETFGIGQFVADAERRTGAFADEQVALPEPCGVLLIDGGIAVATLFRQTELLAADMFSQHVVGELDVGNHAAVEVGVNATATDRAGKIDVSSCRNLSCHVFCFHRSFYNDDKFDAKIGNNCEME